MITFGHFLVVMDAAFPGLGDCIAQSPLFLFKPSPPPCCRRGKRGRPRTIDRCRNWFFEDIDFLNGRWNGQHHRVIIHSIKW